MGNEYKKRTKELYGRDAVVGNEVVNMGGTLAPASVDHVVLLDPFGAPRYVLNRPAKLDGVTIQVSPQLVGASGSVTVYARVDGVTRGSGTVPAAAGLKADFMFETEKSQDVRLVSGAVLELRATKPATPSGIAVSARALLRLYEN